MNPYNFYQKSIVFAFALITTLVSCSKSLDVDLPKSQIVNEEVFSNDVTATAAMLGIYADFLNESFVSSGSANILSLTGLSSDELYNFNQDPLYVQFEQNSLTANNPYILSIWKSLYKTIYQANAILEGLEKFNGVTGNTKKQLEGEARFTRAFAFFYLSNLFGDIPLITTTNYQLNAMAPKSNSTQIYNQIVLDLIKAQELLTVEYISIEDDQVTKARVRPNRLAATALLSRVYLYNKNWIQAEIQASTIIETTSLYQLSNDLESVFLKNSEEAIWQLKPKALSGPELSVTFEANIFSQSNIYYNNAVREDLFNSFEEGDKRKVDWVTSFTADNKTIYRPIKYKNAEANFTEYSTVLRLAEQYLIRAEAKIQQGKLGDGIDDMNVLRAKRRASPTQDTPNPLPELSRQLSKDESLAFLENERRVELFTEWGHRWFDIKRWDKVRSVLSTIKANVSNSDALYPLPQSELNRNPNMKPQNVGY